MPFRDFTEALAASRRARKRVDEAAFTVAAFPVWLEHGAQMKLSFSKFLAKLGLGEAEKNNPTANRLKAKAAIGRAEQIRRMHKKGG